MRTAVLIISSAAASGRELNWAVGVPLWWVREFINFFSQNRNRTSLKYPGVDFDHASYKYFMNKIQHPSNNGVLGAPAGWDQGELPCSALPITHTHVGDLLAVVSYWRPSVEELAVLDAGGAIALWVLGATMPPVILSVEST